MIVYSLIFVVFRALLLWPIFSSGWVACFFGLSELYSLVCTVGGLRAGVVDRSWLGMLVPLSYVLPLCVVAVPGGSHVAFSVLFALCVAKVVFRFWLGRSVSVGVPVFTRVVSSGPWAWLRHPMHALDMLTCLALAWSFPSRWNWLIVTLAIELGVICVVAEERFLRRWSAYREYQRMVSWRLVPGVW